MNTFLKILAIPVLLLTVSSMANATGLVWGTGKWGEASWGVSQGSVTPPSGPVPTAVKVRSITGSPTTAGFGGGAYSAVGTPVYSNSFVTGDFITLIGEVYPDTADVGKDGELFVLMLSVIGGKQFWSFLDTEGNFETWDLKLANLGPAKIVEPLEQMHSITIFEGNLQKGSHRLAIGYMAKGGPLVYTPKAINIVVGD